MAGYKSNEENSILMGFYLSPQVQLELSASTKASWKENNIKCNLGTKLVMSARSDELRASNFTPLIVQLVRS